LLIERGSATHPALLATNLINFSHFRAQFVNRCTHEKAAVPKDDGQSLRYTVFY
jgi:hypothetical protein